MFLIDKLPTRIYIGNEGEENATQVKFDVSAWDALYPDAVYSITYVRPGETTVYPEIPSHVVHAAGVLTWTPSESVLDISDYGTLVIKCTEDDVKKKSVMTMFFVARSHPSSGAAPDPIADWVSDATAKLAEVDPALGLAADATLAANTAAGRADTIAGTLEGIAPKWAAVDISASGLAAGASPTASVTQDVGGTHLTVGIPKGDKGDTGDIGPQGPQGLKGEQGDAGASITQAAFVGDDLVFTKDDAGTVTLENAKPDLTGPQGEQGPKGDQGVQGEKGEKGDPGDTGPQGLKGDKGDKGDQGIQGVKGETGNGIVSVNRTSGDGTPGSVDTYTIQFDEGATTFPVYNGADAPSLAGVHQYIIRWDKVNSQCTRMGDAAAITTNITNFCHRGSVNASYSNPFDSLYPWKYRKLCKVNRAAYALLAPGSPITDAVTMWEGEPGFALDGTGDFDGVYTPEFWGRVWQDATYVYAGVADGPIPGWIHYEATIGGRYFGSMDVASKITSIAGSLPLRNTRMDTMHTNVTSQGMTLDDIFTWCADSLLMAVEYATLNSQTAIGSGCDGLNRQSAEKVGEAASVGATLIKLPNAFVSACVAGALIGLGTSNGGEQTGVTRFISSADLDGADPLFATHKGVTVPALTVNVTTDTYVSIHGCYNAPDAAIGSLSGYLGINGKCNAYYRGRVAHANYFRYVLGAYRQTGTDRIWVANSRAEAAAADALNTGVHRDTGKALPAAEGYIAALGLDTKLPLAPFCTASGGTAGGTNPVGDYCYKPAIGSGNTILVAGGDASNGSYCGRFSGSWRGTASASNWHIAALPFLKTP